MLIRYHYADDDHNGAEARVLRYSCAKETICWIVFKDGYITVANFKELTPIQPDEVAP